MGLYKLARMQSLCVLALTAGLALSGCGATAPGDGGGSSVPAEGFEKPYNATPISYSGTTVTISSLAQFKRFDDYGYDVNSPCTSGSPCKVGLVHTATYNIRYAEVHLYNKATGALVQAGETSSTGTITMVMPRTAGTYTLEVHSRADNTNYKASVLNNPYDKTYYKISADFTLVGNESGTLGVTLPVAPYNGTMEGAAFNILNDVLLANEYLRLHAKTNNSSGTADYCPSSVCPSNFTVAPKVSVYWAKGISPGVYQGSSSYPISFFVPESGGGLYEGLYILGGIEGDICTDTDHYDNSVILHEYGHFLEKSFATSNSPGGSHSGNKIIDPRLAWSEGWADFFQGAVLSRSFYRDTTKNADCSSSWVSSLGGYYTARLSFPDINIEAKTTDIPLLAGEGNFHEVSVARMLFDTITGPNQTNTTNPDTIAADLGFSVVWQSFTQLTDTAFHGRSVGHFNSKMTTNLTSMLSLSSWDDGTSSKTLGNEKQRSDLRDFGLPLSPASTSCPSNAYGISMPWVFTATGPKKDTTSSGYIDWSDMFNTNDFYLYYYDGTTAHSTVKLVYQKYASDSSGISDPWDLDLYIYRDNFVFLDGSDIVAMSENIYPESGGSGFESVNFATKNLPAGYYFINIKVDYVGSTAPARAGAQYTLELGNGEHLCP